MRRLIHKTFFVALLSLVFQCVQTEDVQLIVKPQNTTAIPGQQVNLKCVFRVTVPSTCYWSKNDENIMPDGKELIFSGDVSKGDCSLQIPQAKLINDGFYKCGYMSSGSQQGIMSDPPAKVTILDMPTAPQMIYQGKIVDPDTQLRFSEADANLPVQCLVKDGNPAADIKWFLDDKEIRGNTTITKNVQEPLVITSSEVLIFTGYSNHTKYLSCIATHPAYNTTRKMQSTSSMILINGPVREVDVSFMNKTGPIITVNSGDYIEMNCTAFSEPPPKFEWQKQTRGSDNWQKLENENRASVNIQPTNGFYRCGASNSETSGYMYSEKLEVTIESTKKPGLRPGAIIGTVILSISFVALLTATIYYMYQNKKCCFRRKYATRRQEMSEIKNKDPEEFHMINPDSKIPQTTKTPQESQEGEDKERALTYATLDFSQSTGKNRVLFDMASSESVNYAVVVPQKSTN